MYNLFNKERYTKEQRLNREKRQLGCKGDSKYILKVRQRVQDMNIWRPAEARNGVKKLIFCGRNVLPARKHRYIN